MKKNPTFLIVLFAIIIVILWAILAFFIREDMVQRFSLWSSMVVGTAATIISIVALRISYMTYKGNIESDKKVDNKIETSIDNKEEKIDNSIK